MAMRRAAFPVAHDKWKDKFMDAKRNVKRLTEQFRYWKGQSEDQRRRVGELEEVVVLRDLRVRIVVDEFGDMRIVFVGRVVISRVP